MVYREYRCYEMKQLREALINKSNIGKVSKDKEYFIYTTNKYETVETLKHKLKAYEIDNAVNYMWLLSKNQLDEIFDKYVPVRNDKSAKLYIVPSRKDLEKIKNAPKSWYLSQFIKEFGLILTANPAW